MFLESIWIIFIVGQLFQIFISSNNQDTNRMTELTWFQHVTELNRRTPIMIPVQNKLYISQTKPLFKFSRMIFLILMLSKLLPQYYWIPTEVIHFHISSDWFLWFSGNSFIKELHQLMWIDIWRKWLANNCSSGKTASRCESGRLIIDKLVL